MRRIGGEKRLEAGFGLRILPRLKGLQRRIELLARLIEHRHSGADDCRSARGRRSLARFGRRGLAELERLTRSGPRRLAHQWRARRCGSERPRRPGRVRVGVGIERVRRLPRPCRRGRLAGALGGFSDVRRRGGALGAVAEPVFDVLAELLQLSLEPMLDVLQFLDPAVGLPELLLELVDAQHQLRGLVGVACGAARNVGRRRLAVERIELGLSRRRERDAGDERRHEAWAKQGRHWRFPRSGLIRRPIGPASVDFKSSRKRPLSLVQGGSTASGRAVEHGDGAAIL